MIISSELTGKTYSTVDECLKAEEEFKKKKEEEAKAKKKYEEELDKAFDEAVAACNKYFKLAGEKGNINSDILDEIISFRWID